MFVRYRWWIAVTVLLLCGALLKSVAVEAGRADLGPEAQTGRLTWPWGGKATVTAYFPEPASGHLIAVERTVSSASPEAALAELFAGPNPKRPLEPAIPPGLRLTGVQMEGDRAVLATEGGALPESALRAMALTLGVRHLEANGQAITVESGTRLFYIHRGMALPVTLRGEQLDPRQAVEALLSRPAPDGVVWLPPGVSLDGFEQRKQTAYVRLRFSPELEELVESGAWNFAPYYMGLVYTLTEFAGIERVHFEFTGLSQVALKQCRTPLSIPLERPAPEAGRAKEGR